MTINEASQLSRTILEPLYGEGESGAMTDLLMKNLSGKRNWRQPGSSAITLEQPKADLLEQYLTRLLASEPIQYILNEAWFSGLRLYVDHHVLIPRPETEELVEWVISDRRFPLDHVAILDIGSGSGCIPLALKKRLGKASVMGIDVSAGALKVAAGNAETLKIPVTFREIDFLDQSAWPALGSFDVITSNPPYIPLQENKTLPKNVLDHEPLIALFVPDDDAMLFYRNIAAFGRKHLNVDGAIYVEIHEDLAGEVTDVFTQMKYATELRRDLQGKQRMMKAWMAGMQ